MFSVCHDIKKEYEDLQNLKQKFASACAEANNFDTLSKAELIKLKKLKRNLEQKRDELEEKIETKETKTWRNMYDAVLSAVFPEGVYIGRSVKELIETPEFTKNFIDDIESNARAAQHDNPGAWEAVEGFYAALGLGILCDEDRVRIQELMKHEKFKSQLNQYIVSRIGPGQRKVDGVVTWYAARGCSNELGLELIKEELRANIQTAIFDVNFQSAIADSIRTEAEEAQAVDGGPDAWYTPIALQAAIGLGIVDTWNRSMVQEQVETLAFNRNIVHEVLGNSRRGQKRGEDARILIRCLYAMRELITLTRRRKNK